MAYEAKQFDHLLGLAGFSDQLLHNHFTLYQGYVTNTNKVLDELGKLAAEAQLTTPQAAELRRRLGWEWNGMRLHELYFGNLSKETRPLGPDSSLAQKLAESFGSLERWEAQFRAAAAMRGIGWVILYRDRADDRLIISWINEHDAGHLAGAEPLLVMDVFEHAFMLDYGLKRSDYIDAFMRAIDWTAVSARS